MGQDQNDEKFDLQKTDLWTLFNNAVDKDNAADKEEFKAAVKKICADGERLSATIIKFFPTFTRHDWKHIQGVCNWMVELLGEKKEKLTAEEAALLLMAAHWHDSGMSVDDDEKQDFEQRLKEGRKTDWRYDEEWFNYFEKHPEDVIAFDDDENASELILQTYIREHHHERAQNKLTKYIPDWPQVFTNKGISCELVAQLCQSHGERLSVNEDNRNDNIDYELCAVLLRLADILDYDEERAPYVLFQYMGLNHPRTAEKTTSRDEFKKNMAGCFHLNDSHKKTHYSAKCTDPNIEEGLRNYLKWVENELEKSRAILSEKSQRWNDLQLPYEIISEIEREGYEASDFKLTLDQDRIIELLVGQNIYSDPGVFVRELLQNSIDAILDRSRLDTRFRLEEGRIDIYTWRDENGDSWFRIEDNGTGMDERILKNYFLKVGCSYYTSKEYKMSEKRTDIKSGFKPTSRFGIGILSCFLSNREQNQVEVETMRFSEDRRNPNKTLRLFIPNLHGSYYLVNNSTKTDKKMHFPRHEPDLNRFRNEPGTTICVHISRYCVFEQSFRELLDKYVVFPEVQVVHHDSSEKDEPVKEYYTQAKLMEHVSRICGEKDSKEIVHPISDSLFESIKQEMPQWKWDDSNRPEIVFTVYRYDLLSQNTAGVECRVDVKTAVNTKLPFSYKDEEYETSLQTETAFSGRSDGTLNISIEFEPTIGEDVSTAKEDIFDIMKSFRDQFGYMRTITCDCLRDLNKRLSDDEIELLHLLGNKQQIAYNGILIQQCGGNNSNFSQGSLLWRGSNYPEVDIARNKIQSLPLETEFELELLNIYLNIEYEPTSLHYSENDCSDILKCHPNWENKIKYRIIRSDGKMFSASIVDLERMVESGENIDFRFYRLSDYSMAVLKRHFAIGIGIQNESHSLTLSTKENQTDTDLTAFPPSMFINDRECLNRIGTKSLFIPCIYSNKILNPQHRFAKWLISQQTQLLEKVPNQYYALLEMLKDAEYRKINKVLEKLQQFPAFGIEKKLFLSLEDVLTLEVDED